MAATAMAFIAAAMSMLPPIRAAAAHSSGCQSTGPPAAASSLRLMRGAADGACRCVRAAARVEDI